MCAHLKISKYSSDDNDKRCYFSNYFVRFSIDFAIFAYKYWCFLVTLLKLATFIDYYLKNGSDGKFEKECW